MRLRSIWSLALAALLVTGAAACSSDGGSKGKAQRDDVIAAANGVCQQATATAAADSSTYSTTFGTAGPSESQARDFLLNVIAVHLDATVGALHKVPLPLVDSAKWQRALDALDEQLRTFKYSIDQSATSLAKSTAERDLKKTTTVGQLFVDFGAKDCASL